MDDLNSTASFDDEQTSVESIAKLIDSMASHVLDHPGFMWTSGGFEVIHANWPAYPTNRGPRSGLSLFGDFPSDTKFFPIDNVDQCTLFIAGKVPDDNEFDKKYYHIALEDDDIRELAANDFIDGASVVKGELEYHGEGISLSSKGEHAILIYELTFDVHTCIMEQVEDFLLSKRYDTAVREAALLVETQLRRASGSQGFGQKLIDECFGEESTFLPANVPNSTRLEIRATFRRFFKYVRNDFAHNFVSLNLVTTSRLLRRCSHLLELIDTVEKSGAA